MQSGLLLLRIVRTVSSCQSSLKAPFDAWSDSILITSAAMWPLLAFQNVSLFGSGSNEPRLPYLSLPPCEDTWRRGQSFNRLLRRVAGMNDFGQLTNGTPDAVDSLVVTSRSRLLSLDLGKTFPHYNPPEQTRSRSISWLACPQWSPGSPVAMTPMSQLLQFSSLASFHLSISFSIHLSSL